MTVEAACVLPLFLTAIIMIACVFNMYYVHRLVGNSIDNVCRTISAWAYPIEKAGKEMKLEEVLNFGLTKDQIPSNLPDGFTPGNLMSAAVVSAVVTSEVRKDPVADSLLYGSIDCLKSKILLDDQIVDIVAAYELKLPFSLFDTKGMRFIQRSRMHAWNGYRPIDENAGNKDTEYVFVTETGTVYHRSETCTYLKPSVRSVSGNILGTLRNNSGAKYYPCEVCKPASGSSIAGLVYITNYGTRYHSSSKCSAIERNYKKVPLSEVEGILPPCSKCGGK